MGRIQPSMLVEQMVGTTADVTVMRGRTGLVTQGPKKYRRVISPLQAQAMARMERAGLAWENLSEANVEAWRGYAKGILRRGDVGGKAYHPLAFNVFSGRYCKMLQIDPSAEPPAWPPQTSFFRDAVSVSVSALPDAILYTASQANHDGMMTELLVQKLPGRHRLPKPAYNSAGFKAFRDGDLTFSLEMDPGYYACAFNIVEPSTGRTGTVLPLGTLAVGL